MKPLTQFPTFLLILLAGSFELLASGITVLKNAEGTLSAEVESNNDINSANLIYSDLQVTGNISETDEDYFTFSLSEPSLMTLSSTGMKALIQVFNPDGSELYYKNYESNGFSTLLSGVSSGNYLVKISRTTTNYSDVDHDYDFTLSFPQNISPEQIQSLTSTVGNNTSFGFSVLKDTTNSISAETESNNLSSVANLIFTDFKVLGNISETDEDYFTFSLSEPSLMTLSSTSMKALIQVFNPDGSELYYKNYESNGFSTLLSGVSSGNYLVKISRTTTNYSDIDHDYDFTMSFPQNISPENVRISNLEGNVASLTAQLTDTNASLQSALASNSTLTAEKASLETQLATANNDISTLTTQLTDTNASLQSAFASNSTLTAEKAGLETQLATANNDVSTLTSQLTDTNASLQSALASNSTLTAEKASLETQLATANNDISTLTTQLTDTNASLQSALASNSTLTAEKAGLETQLATANNDVSTLTSQLTDTNASLQSALASNSTLTAEKAGLETQLATANNDVSTLTSQLTDTNASLQSALASNLTLPIEETSLEAQLQTANTRISELESELATLKSQQSSNSNPSSTTNTSNNQSSSSSSTAVEVKKVASIKAYGLQFSLSPSYTDTGSTIYFTSYDGSSGYPLNDNNTVSSEVKNLTLGSSSFYTDYLVAEGYVYMHGTAILNMPTTDSDGNGVLDFLQKERSVNTTVSGSSKMHWLSPGAYGSDSSLSGSFTRSAGLNTGNYTFDYQYDSVKASATGVWSVQYFDGSIEYDGEKYYLDIETTNSEGQDIKAYSTAEYSVTDSNTLNLGAMSITTDYDSSILQTQSTTLKRSGNKYSGYLKALDGDTDTSWADYVDWYVEVTDLNDANSDGVPDFTNPVETKSAIRL
jgi:regulator of replication initiation timing